MNSWILSAGIICTLTSLLHIFAGQVDPVRPFLNSDLAPIPKATFLACWHMVSAVLVLGGLTLTYVGWYQLTGFYDTVLGVSAVFVLFSFIFIGVGWTFFGAQTFIKLPQWILLLPIGALGMIGTISI